MTTCGAVRHVTSSVTVGTYWKEEALPAQKVKGVGHVEETNRSLVPAVASRRCPAFPSVPIMLIAVMAVALVAVIAFSLAGIHAGHPSDLASGIIWAKR
jgi:hypothetical protein